MFYIFLRSLHHWACWLELHLYWMSLSLTSYHTLCLEIVVTLIFVRIGSASDFPCPLCCQILKIFWFDWSIYTRFYAQLWILAFFFPLILLSWHWWFDFVQTIKYVVLINKTRYYLAVWTARIDACFSVGILSLILDPNHLIQCLVWASYYGIHISDFHC